MDRYGLRCKKTCPLCENLGICHPNNGSCICSPGFIGTLCDKRKSVYTCSKLYCSFLVVTLLNTFTYSLLPIFVSTIVT